MVGIIGGLWLNIRKETVFETSNKHVTKGLPKATNECFMCQTQNADGTT